MTQPTPTPRQTLSYLRDLFERNRMRPKNKLGQNFLIDLNLIDLLLRTAELSEDDVVLEVGSGTGNLTARIAERAGVVVSVELDPDFFELTCQATAHCANVYLIHTDVLKGKNEINPDVFGMLDEALRRSNADTPGVPFPLKLVANLPYAVAAPVIANLLLSERVFERMVVTVQWEMAERLSARPSTKDYSALSVLVQSLADVHVIRRIGPSVFWPRPQVSSAIVCIRPDPVKRARVGDVMKFRHFLRDLYTQRRKYLRSALASGPRGRRDKEEVDRLLKELGIDGNCRAEELDVEDHLRLCAVFG